MKIRLSCFVDVFLCLPAIFLGALLAFPFLPVVSVANSFSLDHASVAERQEVGTVVGKLEAFSAGKVIDVASGPQHTLFLMEDKTVWASGWNDSGQLGDGTTKFGTSPVQVTGMENVSAIAVGSTHSLFLKEDGSVWGCGYHGHGQLGLESTAPSLTPVQIPGIEGVVAIGTGFIHSLFVKSDGTVWGCGANSYGQLGQGDFASYVRSVVQVQGIDDVKAVAASREHSVFLKNDGTVWACGSNDAHKLGIETNDVNVSTVIEVTGLSNVVAITAERYGSTYYRQDGTVWMGGSSVFWEYGLPDAPYHVPALDGVVARARVMSPFIQYYLREDGAIWAHEKPTEEPYLVTGIEGIVSLSALHESSAGVFLKEDCTVWAIGDLYEANSRWVHSPNPKSYKEAFTEAPDIYEEPTELLFPAAEGTFSLVAGGGDVDNGSFTIEDGVLKTAEVLDYEQKESHSIRVRATFDDGTTSEQVLTVSVEDVDRYFALGDNTIPENADSGTEVGAFIAEVPMQVAADQNHSYVLHKDGSLWGVGENRGQFGLGNRDLLTTPVHLEELGAVTAVSTGYAHSLFLKADGTVLAAGQNSAGELGDGISENRWEPVEVQGLEDVVAISAGSSYSLFLKGDGTAWATGSNDKGQLGDGSTQPRKLPVQVLGGNDYIAIAAGSEVSYFLKSDGTVWGCGRNDSGQLGGGKATANKSTPVKVEGIEDVVAISAGFFMGLFLKSDGTVWSVGWNLEGQLGDGTKENRASPVQVSGLEGIKAIVASRNHSMFLREDGTVWACGKNTSGQLGGSETEWLLSQQIPGLEDVVSIAGGEGHSLAMKSDGTVLTLGSNSRGQLGDGTTNDSSTPVQFQLGDSVSVGTPTSYSLVAGDGDTDNASFTISGTSLEAAVPFDYEGKDAYSVRVRTTFPDGDVEEKVLAVKVKDVEEGYRLKSQSIAESEDVGAVVGEFAKSGATRVVGIFPGVYSTFYSLEDGSLWGVGLNQFGQLGNGTSQTQELLPIQIPTLDNVVSATSESENDDWGFRGDNYSSVFLTDDGTAWYSGRSRNSGFRFDTLEPQMFENVSDIVEVALQEANGWLSWLFLRSDGTVWGLGINSAGALGNLDFYTRSITQIEGLTDIVAVARGDFHTLYLKSDGTVLATGINQDGQFHVAGGEIRNGSNPFTSPVAVDGLSGIKAIAADRTHSFFLKSDGTVFVGGYSIQGLLGTGNTDKQFVPVQVPGLSDIIAISTSKIQSLFLKSDGTVWAAGSNQQGQFGNGTTEGSFVPVQIPDLSDVIAIYAGKRFSGISFFLKSDGTAWATGYTAYAGIGRFNYVPVMVEFEQGSTSTEEGPEPSSYELIAGDGDADNGSFTIDGTELKVAEVFDFEGKDTYSIRVKATYPDASTEEIVLTISVENVNEPLVLEPIDDLEGEGGFAKIIPLTASDLDGDELEYIVDVPVGIEASVEGNILTLIPSEFFSGTETVTLTATDGEFSDEQSFNFTVNALPYAASVPSAVSGDEDTSFPVLDTPLVTTVAGSEEGYVDGQGTDTKFNNPIYLVAGPSGDIFVADANNHRIRKIAPDGTVTTFVGSGSQGLAEGDAATAQFNQPHGIAMDQQQNLYVGNLGSHTIQKVTPGGDVTILAGGNQAGYADGSGSSARFDNPLGMAVDRTRNFLYVADRYNESIRKIDLNLDKEDGGFVTTLAGLSDNWGFADGTGSDARFDQPWDLDVDSQGNLYVFDHINKRIRKITPEGVVTTIAGTGQNGYADGPGASAVFNFTQNVVVYDDSTLFVANNDNPRMRKVELDNDNTVSTIFGTGNNANTDGTFDVAEMSVPWGLAQYGDFLYFTQPNSFDLIRKVNLHGQFYAEDWDGDQLILTFTTENGTFSASAAGDATVEGDGTASISIAGNTTDANATARTLVFTPVTDFFGEVSVVYTVSDGHTATPEASFTITVNPVNDGPPVLGPIEDQVAVPGETLTINLDVSDIDGDELVYTIQGPDSLETSVEGQILTIKPSEFYSGENTIIVMVTDGEETDQQSFTFSLNSVPYAASVPSGVSGDEDTSIPVLGTPLVTTVAGSEEGYVDGQGTDTKFNNPIYLVAGPSGDIFVADANNHRIRKIAPDGTVTTFVGSGSQGLAEGDAATAQFNQPHGIAMDQQQNLYVGNLGSHTIQKVTPGGDVTILAGGNQAGYADGSGSSARFDNPLGMAVDRTRNFLYVADRYNESIRKIDLNLDKEDGGFVTTLAGLSDNWGFADGTGSDARFDQPWDLDVDSQGNLYVFDHINKRIRKITPEGVVTTIAGTGQNGYADGPGASAVFNFTQNVVVYDDSTLFVANNDNPRMRKVELDNDNTVSTIFGTGNNANTDGTFDVAEMSVPWGLAQYGDFLYFTQPNSFDLIRKVNLHGQFYAEDWDGDQLICTFTVTNGTLSASAAGAATVDGDGTATIVISGNETDTNATLRNLVYHPAPDFFGLEEVVYTVSDGDATTAEASFPIKVFPVDDGPPILDPIDDMTAGSDPITLTLSATDPDNEPLVYSAVASANIYISVEGNVLTLDYFVGGESITVTVEDGNGGTDSDTFTLTVDASPTIGGLTFVAGLEDSPVDLLNPPGVETLYSGVSGFLDGALDEAMFGYAIDIISDREGNLYIADSVNFRIRKVTPAGEVTTLAGSGDSASIDGLGTEASFKQLVDLAIDSQGNLYSTDHTTIRKIAPNGEVTTLAGDGNSGIVNGSAAQSRFAGPRELVYDPVNNLLYVANFSLGRIRAIHLDLEESDSNFVQDVVTFGGATDMVVDDQGNLYLSNYSGISRVDPGPVLTPIVETDSLNRPAAMAWMSGSLYYADNNAKFNKVDLGNNNELSIVFGVAGAGWEQDGSLDQARLLQTTTGMTVVDQSLYFARSSRGKDTSLRKVTPEESTLFVADDDSANLTVDLTAEHGALSVTTSGSVSITGDGDAVMQISGTIADVNATLASLQFMPEADFSGTASVEYTVTDGNSTSTPKIIGIEIENTNDAPVFSTIPDQELDEDAVLELDVSTYVSDPDGDNLSFGGSGDSVIFTVSYTATTVRIKPAKDWNGTDSFTLVADDGNGGTMETAFQLTVHPMDDAPTITGPVSFDGEEDQELSLWSEPYVTTVAQTGFSWNATHGVVVDSSGNLFIAEGAQNRIIKVDSSGEVSIFAGDGTKATIEGTGEQASLNRPMGMAIDSSDNLYVVENKGNIISKITPFGEVTTLVGKANEYASKDGNASDARVYTPTGVTYDPLTNSLYLAEYYSAGGIRKIDLGLDPSEDGFVTTLAGGGTRGFLDGTGNTAQFKFPTGTVVDSAGNVYVTDTWNSAIRKVTPDGVVTTIAGGTEGFLDGIGVAARFNKPEGIALLDDSTLLVVDTSNHRIRKIDLQTNEVTTLVGTGTSSSDDGPLTSAQLSTPKFITIHEGNAYFTESGGRVRKAVFTTSFLVGNPDGGEVSVSFIVPKGLLDVTLVGAASKSGGGTGELSITGTVEEINSILESLAYTPETEQYGDVQLVYTVSNGDLTSPPEVSNINLAEVNDAPVFGTFDQIEAEPGETVTIELDGTATDADGDGLQYSFFNTTKYTAELNGTQLVVSPGPSTTGLVIVSLKVIDGNGGVGAGFVQINFGEPDLPPVLDPVGNHSLEEDGQLQVTLSGTDPEAGALVFTAQSSANITASVEGDVLTLEPAVDWYGSEDITVTVEDAAGGTDTETFAVTVQSVNDLPVLGEIAAQATDENVSLTFALPVSDVETAGGEMDYTVVIPGGQVVSSVTGTDLTLTPVTNWFGSVDVTVTVDDKSGGSASQTFTLTVNPVNNPPVLAEIGKQEGEEDTPLVLTLSATDVDSVDLTYSAESSANLTASVEGSELTLTPEANWYGTEEITVTVEDGLGAQDSETFRVTLFSVNDIISLANITNQSVAEDSALPLTLEAEDVDGDVLTYDATPGSDNVMATVSGNKLTLEPVDNWNGTESITLESDDGQGGLASKVFNLTVFPLNDAPVLEEISTQTTAEDTPLTVDLIASDADAGDTATFSVSLNSADVSASVSGSQLTLVPATDWYGSVAIEVTVTDQLGAKDTKEFVLVVSSVNDAPELASVPDQSMDEDLSLSIGLSASDADNDVVTFSAQVEPANVGAVVTGNQLALTPEPDWSGDVVVTVTASDPNGGQVNTTFGVSVGAVNDDPILSDPGPQIMDEDATRDIDLVVSDPDGDTLTLSVTAPPQVQASISGSTLTLTPDADWNGSGSVTVAADDGNGGVVSQTVPLTIAAVNDAPVLADISDQAIDEDGSAVVTLSGTDVDGDTVAFSVSAGDNVSAKLTGSTLQLVPNADWNGDATVTVTASDGNGGTDVHSFELAVAAVNDAPVLLPVGTLSTDEDSELSFSLQALDPDDDELTYTVDAGDNLTETVVGGEVTLVPDADWYGQATVTATVDDGNGETDTLIFAVNVVSVNDAPIVTEIEEQSTDEDVPLVLELEATDVEGADIGFTVVVDSDDVTASLDGTELTLTPAAFWSGFASVTVFADDGTGGTAQVDFELIVNPVNNAPSFTTVGNQVGDEDVPVVITLSAVDAEGEDLTYTSTSSDNLAASVDGAELTLTPTANWYGTEEITVTVEDTNGGQDTETFKVTLFPVNDIISLDFITDQEMDEDSILPLTLEEEDVDGDTLTYTVTPGSTDIKVTVTGNKVAIEPIADWNGLETIFLESDDGQGGTNFASFTLTVNPVNDAPVLASIPTQSIVEDGQIFLEADAEDVDGDFLAITAVTGADNVVVDVLGTFLTLTPRIDFNGIETVTLTADDGNGGTDTITFSMFVSSENDDPVLEEIPETFTDEDTPSTITLAATDVDSVSLVYSADVLLGDVTTSVSGDQLTLTPAADWNGVATISVIVDDQNGGSDSQEFQLFVFETNDAPVIKTVDAISGSEDSEISLSLVATDVDGDTLITYSDGTANLSASSVGDSIVLTPAADWNGTETVQIAVVDEWGEEVTKNIDVTVNPENDAPVMDAVDPQSLSEDTTKDVTLSATDVDDGDTLVYSAASSAHIDATVSGTTLTLTPAADWNGTETILVGVEDGNGGSDTTSFDVTVTPANDLPVLVSISDQTTLEDVEKVISLSASDIDGDDLEFQVQDVANITESVNGSTLTLTPDQDWNGTETITVSVTDNQDDPVILTFDLTVTPVNDAPVLDAIDPVSLAEDSSKDVTLGATDIDEDSVTYTATGSANIQVSVSGATLTLTPAANFNGTETIVVTVSDGNGGEDTGSVEVTVTPVNDPPSIEDPGPQSFTEKDIFTIQLIATDLETQDLGVDYTTSDPGLWVVSQVGTTLNLTADGWYGNASVTVTVTDDGQLTDLVTFAVEVSPFNIHPPVHTIPTDQQIDTSVPYEFSVAEGNPIQVDDQDSTHVTMTLEVAYGILKLHQTTGLQFFQNTTDESAKIVIYGSIGDINAALDGITYCSTTGYVGGDTIKLSTVDNGNLTDEDDLPLTVEIVALPGQPNLQVSTLANPTKTLTNIEVKSFDEAKITTAELKGEGEQMELAIFPIGKQDGSVEHSTVEVEIEYDDGTTETVTVPVVIYYAKLVVTQEVEGLAQLNRSTGLYESFIEVENTTPYPIEAIRMHVDGITGGALLQTITGTGDDGVPFVQYDVPMTPGEVRTFKLEYRVPGRRWADPTTDILLELLPEANQEEITGEVVDLAVDLQQAADQSYYLGFITEEGQTYYIQYADSLDGPWQTSPISVEGNNLRQVWVDDGLPKTSSHPSEATSRFYRIIIPQDNQN